MIEHWLRWYHGTASDPKWRVIVTRARHAMSRHVTIAEVLAVWACMVECASQANPRGELQGWCDEDIGAALDLDETHVAGIRAAMQGKTLDGNRLTAWEKRQPKRERDDATAAERKRAQRGRDASQAVQLRRDNEASHHVTHRVEEKREEKKELSLSVEPSVQAPSAATLEPPPDTSIDSKAEPQATALGSLCKALRKLGMVRAHPGDAYLKRLLDDGVPEQEILDTYSQFAASNPNGKFLHSVISRQRAEAAAAPSIAGKPKVSKPASHEPYKPPPRRNADPNAPMPVALTDLAKTLGLTPPT